MPQTPTELIQNVAAGVRASPAGNVLVDVLAEAISEMLFRLVHHVDRKEEEYESQDRPCHVVQERNQCQQKAPWRTTWQRAIAIAGRANEKDD